MLCYLDELSEQLEGGVTTEDSLLRLSGFFFETLFCFSFFGCRRSKLLGLLGSSRFLVFIVELSGFRVRQCEIVISTSLSLLLFLFLLGYLLVVLFFIDRIEAGEH